MAWYRSPRWASSTLRLSVAVTTGFTAPRLSVLRFGRDCEDLTQAEGYQHLAQGSRDQGTDRFPQLEHRRRGLLELGEGVVERDMLRDPRDLHHPESLLFHDLAKVRLIEVVDVL